MTVGLIDVDGRVIRGSRRNGKRFPNLVLMKLSAWHKSIGDTVEWCFPLKRYDRVYASKVFTSTPDIDFVPQTEDFRRGGTGYFYPDGGESLPDDVEHIMPDYALYGITDTAYGFMTRGCPRGCQFCIVSKKEGRASVKVADLREFWNGQKNIELMDPNTLACPEWREVLGQLEESGACVNFNQGVDIRLMTDEKAESLMRIKLRKIHFAWDNPNDDLEPLFRRFSQIFHSRIRDRELVVYCLANYSSSHEDDLRRIYTLRDLGYSPYVMVYDKTRAPRRTRMLQRWVNNRAVFRTVKSFDDYKKGSTRDDSVQET